MPTEKLSSRAIVIGGGVAGKLSARVLADYFEEVMIIEKDHKQDQPQNRSGVPQGLHGHALLKSGEEILEEFFPGIIDELQDSGAVSANFSRDLAWFHHGSWKIRSHSQLMTIQQSRPFLEYHIQKRLQHISNVHSIYGAKPLRLVLDAKKTSIAGIEYQTEEGKVEEIDANLVIDASGAATFTTQWLKKNGIATPPIDEIQVNLCYASRAYEHLSPEDRDWKGLLVYPNPPHQMRGGGMYQIEANKWMVTLFGYGLDSPPKTDKEFLEHAAILDHPSFFGAIIDGKPASEVNIYRFPKMRRFRYEKMENLPNGLIVIGDALCRIDPVFAQGMSLSALEAKQLEKVLKQATKHQSLEAISKKAHQEFQRVLSIPWLIASIEDFRFPHTTGNRFFGLSFLQGYIKRVMLACSDNQIVYEKFMNVLHLKAHPATLFAPKMIKSILFKTVTPRHNLDKEKVIRS
ncbi:FAD-dependent monooxygenase [Mesobacillus maritimus]|uniref:FAD-dependent oxidoreductase n=1 Tax=Mesobacillus maritimus TaxID=1643336 RepID=UPI002040BF87|nr:FAD-dependent monooxygenase [Mesobacillus maritimus]MCM3669185.1 FAD-dependent monooxygenase [Mesobacillus maritimus]